MQETEQNTLTTLGDGYMFKYVHSLINFSEY